MRIKSIYDLVVKDLIVYKKMAIAFSALGIGTAITSIASGANSINFAVNIISLVLIFIIGSLTEESKNYGTELLLTTTYTRSDLVVSRYFIQFIIATFISIGSLLSLFLFSNGSFHFLKLIDWYLSLTYILLVIAIFTPLTFIFSYKILPLFIPVILIIIMFLGSIFYKLKTDGFDIDKNIGIYGPIAFIFSIGSIIISMWISNKIFCKKDL